MEGENLTAKENRERQGEEKMQLGSILFASCIYKLYEQWILAILSYPMMSSPCGLLRVISELATLHWQHLPPVVQLEIVSGG